MDEFSKKLMATAQARQKKLESKLTDLGIKIPLHESQPNLSTEAAENANELSKIKRKEINSDSNISKIIQSQTMDQSDSNIHRLVSNSPRSKHGNLTRVSSEIPGKNSPKSAHKTLNILKENFEMEIKFKSTDDMRVEVEIEEKEDSQDDSDVENRPGVDKLKEVKIINRKDVKYRLKQLGKLYTDDGELSSPIQRTEEKFHEELSADTDLPSVRSEENEARRRRLAALASDRKNWEDDLSHPKTHVEDKSKSVLKKSWKPPAPKPPTEITSTSTPLKRNKLPAPKPPIAAQKPALDKKESSKQLKWDKNVLESLESQGFSRAEPTSKLTFDYSKPPSSIADSVETQNESTSNKDDSEIENNTSPIKKIAAKLNFQTEATNSSLKSPKSETKTNRAGPKSPSKNILSRAEIFENASSPTKQKDPALLSVSERKALFEKNKGNALIPKAAFAMPAPLEKVKSDVKLQVETKKASPAVTKRPPAIVEAVEKPTVITKKENSGIAGKLQALLHQATTISESQIRTARNKEKQRELDMLKNRFNKQKKFQHVDQGGSDEEGSISSEEDETTEKTKMIRTPRNKIVSFKQSEESLASIQSRKSVESNEQSSSASTNSADKKTKSSSTTKRRSLGDSPKVQAVLEDVKRIKVSPPKNGRLYPCLSDIEASTANEEETTDAERGNTDNEDNNSSINEEDESGTESEMADTSFGREILEAVSRNQVNLRSSHKRSCLDESTTGSELSDILNDMNEYLDTEQSSDMEETGPTPPKNSKHTEAIVPSHSFHYKSSSSTSMAENSPKITFSPDKNICKQRSPQKYEEKLPTHVMDGDSAIPLIHTVSFYRRQQNQDQQPPSPHKKIVRGPAGSACDDNGKAGNATVANKVEEKLVEEKIAQLMEEVCKQQAVISQTSQALNLCSSTFEFSGSSEEVEAERLLLLATQRRQAALHETQRLRIERTLRPATTVSRSLEDVSSCDLTISDIVLPLKRDYICALTAAGGLGHHLLCLIKYGEHVFTTPLISTGSPPNPPQMCARIPGALKLEHIYPDFAITVEVYSMQAHEEILPHEVKYHIAGKDKKSSKLLTPKKFKQIQDLKLLKSNIQSPVGPAVVRTSSFQLMGYIIFSIKEVNRTHWSLNKIPYISPLEGTIQMQIKCDMSINVELRGFLTMFEDVSGFGAWHRRWCYLKGDTLSYWKYPDDERKKAPINSINLQGCVTENVSLVRRDICARPNTFLLEFLRPKQPNDVDSLVMVVKEDKTLIRHLLSADTKEERIEWCQQLNKALAFWR